MYNVLAVILLATTSLAIEVENSNQIIKEHAQGDIIQTQTPTAVIDPHTGQEVQPTGKKGSEPYFQLSDFIPIDFQRSDANNGERVDQHTAEGDNNILLDPNDFPISLSRLDARMKKSDKDARDIEFTPKGDTAFFVQAQKEGEDEEDDIVELGLSSIQLPSVADQKTRDEIRGRSSSNLARHEGYTGPDPGRCRFR